MSKILIVGLGNPGEKYTHTRHNVGFVVLDALAKKYSAAFIDESKFHAETSAFHTEGGLRVFLAKPQTFMNDSGDAVSKLLNFYKIPASKLIVVHDEIDLPFGSLKLYQAGGAAGHRGVESIIDRVGADFTRLRIGVEARQEYRVPPTDAYVLQKFKPEEEKKLSSDIIPQAVKLLASQIKK